MTGIVAALEAHDDVGLLRQPVDDFALPLVAPLGADDDNIGHFEAVPFRCFQTMIAAKTRPPNEIMHWCARPSSTAPGRAHARRLTDKGSGSAAQARRGPFKPF